MLSLLAAINTIRFITEYHYNTGSDYQPFSLASWFPTVDQVLRVLSSPTQCWWDCIWMSVQFWALHLKKDVENMERVTLVLKQNIPVFLNQIYLLFMAAVQKSSSEQSALSGFTCTAVTVTT